MQKLDWWKIGTLALRTPFARWRLLLRCALIPAILALAMVVTSFSQQGVSWLGQEPNIFLILLNGVGSAPWLVLAWMWMNALWSGDERQVTTFYRTPLFWGYLALFLLVDMATIVPGWLFGLAFGVAFSTGDNPGGQSTVDASGFMPMFLGGFGITILLIWVSIRLVIWGAVIVDHQRIIGPGAIWHLTRGHAFGIFMTLLVIGVVITSASLIVLVSAITPADFHDTLPVLFVSSFLISSYGIAATSAATLLIYRHISGGAIPETAA